MNLGFIVAQFFGLLALAAFIVSTRKKRRNDILAWDGIYCVFISLQYLLLGGLSGFVVGLLQLLRDFVFRQFKKDVPSFATITFCILVFISGIIFFDGPISILPGLHTIIHTIYLGRNDMTIYRFIRLFSLTFMLAYNIYVGAYIGIVLVIVQTVFNTISIVRLDGDKVKKVIQR